MTLPIALSLGWAGLILEVTVLGWLLIRHHR